ncbi:MAG: cytochrome-c peroxidase [Bacteroidetes bacterium]|nr:cytochrome-c peroxidase [Bacteroidota bacterium]
MKTRFTLFIFAMLAWGLYSCNQNNNPTLTTAYLDLPQTPYQYNSGAANDYIPTLGRVLFYDTRLSVSNGVSCASCHKQALAFSDNNKFSRGFNGVLTNRNAMPIQNLRGFGIINGTPIFSDSSLNLSTSLFWDGRETLLTAQVLEPIISHVEMGMTLENLTKKLSQLSEYPSLFKNAYGDEEVTEGKISVALSRFIVSITSNQTKFDLYQQRKIEFSPAELEGFNIFLNKYNCNNCHNTFSFNGSLFTNIDAPFFGGGYVPDQRFIDIGLDTNPIDKGRADVTGLSTDIGRFKIPNLRNVALTAPYMHDGRFATLNEVLEHYSTGIEDSPNLDPVLQTNGSPRRMMISEAEKQSIIAFLYTLTDYSMITDPKFSSPFKSK